MGCINRDTGWDSKASGGLSALHVVSVLSFGTNLNEAPWPEIHSVVTTKTGLDLEGDSFRDRSRCLYF